MGPGGKLPAWFESEFTEYYTDARRTTNPSKARGIVLEVLRNKVEPDANGMPTTKVGGIVWQALINAGIAVGVERDGFVDHKMGRVESLSDDVASRSASALGMDVAAREVGLT